LPGGGRLTLVRPIDLRADSSAIGLVASSATSGAVGSGMSQVPFPAEHRSALERWRSRAFYRRLESRGEICGGRFVAGFSGEQFALPDAIGALREIRRQPKADN
jgi:hypothetical protein